MISPTPRISIRLCGAGVSTFNDIYEIRFGDKTDRRSLEILGKLKELRKLDLCFSDFVTDAGLLHLKGLSRLQHVELMNLKKATAAGFANLAESTDLESLKRSGNALGESGAKFLAGLRKLKALDVSDCSLEPDSLQSIANLTELRELRISNNEIGDAGLKRLGGLSNITSLELYSTNITDAGLEQVGAMKKLAHLNIGNNNLISGAGVKYLAGCKELANVTGEGFQHLAACPKLAKINFSWTGLSDAGLADIKKLTQLTLLDLPPYGRPTLDQAFWRDPHPEKLSDAGLKHIGEMTNLEWLYISGSGPTDAGFAHLSGLKKLKLSKSRHTAKHQGLDWHTSKACLFVTDLNLSQTGVTDESLKNIEGLKQLESLTLPRPATVAALEHLKSLPKLTRLGLPLTWDDNASRRRQEKVPQGLHIQTK